MRPHGINPALRVDQIERSLGFGNHIAPGCLPNRRDNASGGVTGARVVLIIGKDVFHTGTEGAVLAESIHRCLQLHGARGFRRHQFGDSGLGLLKPRLDTASFQGHHAEENALRLFRCLASSHRAYSIECRSDRRQAQSIAG